MYTTIEAVTFRTLWNVDPPASHRSRYNLAPTQETTIVRRGPDGGPQAALARWGLVPAWHRGELADFRAATFNARSEDVATRPVFRDAYRSRRALVPVSGFFEWSGPKGKRTAHAVQRRDGRPLVLAGLWERWRDVETFTVLTCAPNEDVADLHDRMPVVLLSPDWDAWLDPRTPARHVDELLRPFVPGVLETFRVDPAVGRVSVDEPWLIERAERPDEDPD